MKEFPCQTGGSNRGPSDPKSFALPTELPRHLLLGWEIWYIIYSNVVFGLKWTRIFKQCTVGQNAKKLTEINKCQNNASFLENLTLTIATVLS